MQLKYIYIIITYIYVLFCLVLDRRGRRMRAHTRLNHASNPARLSFRTAHARNQPGSRTRAPARAASRTQSQARTRTLREPVRVERVRARARAYTPAPAHALTPPPRAGRVRRAANRVSKRGVQRV